MIENHPKLALCVMVRDEEKTFPRMVESLRHIIDYWIVCDTGSTDDTVNVVRESLAGIPGELHEREWVNFRVNRTEMMVFAQGKADWLLIMDSDQVVERFTSLDELDASQAEAYMVDILGFDMSYRQPKILRGDLIWEWEGVVHEYIQLQYGANHRRLSFDGLAIRELGDGGYRHGDRSVTMERDRKLLEDEVTRNPTDTRSWFYLGQTLRDMGMNKAALVAYSKRVALGGWYEEQYYALYQVGNLHAILGDTDAAVGAWLRAWDMRPTRLEALYAAVRELRIQGRYKTAKLLSEQGMGQPVPPDVLFVHTEIHEFALPLEHSICQYYTDGPAACLAESEALLANWLTPDWIREFADINAKVSRRDLGISDAMVPPPETGTLAVVVPSRGRPHTVQELSAAFKGTCTAPTQLIFSVDNTDPQITEYLQIARTHGVELLVHDNTCMGDALRNAVALVKDRDVAAIGFMGDDHRPRTKGWDSAYLSALNELGSGVVYGNDLLQGENLPTQVAISVSIVRALGVMAPTTLKHMYFDNYWLDLGRAAERITYLPNVVVEHLHPAAGKAEWTDDYARVNEFLGPDQVAYQEYVAAGHLTSDVAKVRAINPGEWKLFDGDVATVSTAHFHQDRARAPHLEQPVHFDRLQLAADFVKDAHSRGALSVSDLGCGDGGFLQLIKQQIPDINAWGYDFQPSNQAGWVERGVTGTLLDWNINRDQAELGDVVVMTEVLEHQSDPQGVLRWLASTDPVRYLVCSSPWDETIDNHDECHAWAWGKQGYRKLVEDAGFTVLRQEQAGRFNVLLSEVTR